MTNIDQNVAGHDQRDVEQQLKEANERATRAERELLALKTAQESVAPQPRETTEDRAGGRDEVTAETPAETLESGAGESEHNIGIQEMRKDSMMAHLLDSLIAKKDIGHYGRLVFAMVARHFLPNESVVAWLQKDSDFSTEAATSLLRQVEGRDYNPPKRERLLEWQMEQSFPILPNVDDPDCGNLYRNLKFPDSVYGHIEHYRDEKVAAAS